MGLEDLASGVALENVNVCCKCRAQVSLRKNMEIMGIIRKQKEIGKRSANRFTSVDVAIGRAVGRVLEHLCMAKRDLSASEGDFEFEAIRQ